MEDQTSFDVVIVGTSLVNSILAGALAKHGKSVLHLDGNEFYGEEEATHDLGTFVDALRSSDHVVGEVRVKGEDAIEARRQEWRSFALDVTPKLLLSCGPLVQLLVQSDCAKYMEFKCLQGAFLQPADAAEAVRVPCSKADVFQSTSISLVEKRWLMKFLTSVQGDVPASWSELSFEAVLNEHQLGPLLQHVIVHAICELDSSHGVSASRGAELILRYLSSVGRFGSTPFLYPLYGCSEMAQAFCRVAAVKGSIYMLRRGLQHLHSSSLVDSEGQKWDFDQVVVSPKYAPSKSQETLSKAPLQYRAYCLLKRALFEPTLVRATQVVHDAQVVHSVHLDASLKICPKDSFLVYLWSSADVIETVIDSYGDAVEWSITYATQARLYPEQQPESNVYVSSDPHGQDYGATVEQAKSLFHRIIKDDRDELFFAKEEEPTEEQ